MGQHDNTTVYEDLIDNLNQEIIEIASNGNASELEACSRIQSCMLNHMLGKYDKKTTVSEIMASCGQPAKDTLGLIP